MKLDLDSWDSVWPYFVSNDLGTMHRKADSQVSGREMQRAAQETLEQLGKWSLQDRSQLLALNRCPNTKRGKKKKNMENLYNRHRIQLDNKRDKHGFL